MSEVLSKVTCDYIPEGDSCGLVVTLIELNAKLRELVMDYEHCILHVDCDMCMYDGTMSEHCPLSPCFPDIDELHELGVEVGL